MNKFNNLRDLITVAIILYKEDAETVKNCLKNIKNFKVIIIDNANNNNLKEQLCSDYKFYKYIYIILISIVIIVMMLALIL